MRVTLARQLYPTDFIKIRYFHQNQKETVANGDSLFCNCFYSPALLIDPAPLMLSSTFGSP